MEVNNAVASLVCMSESKSIPPRYQKQLAKLAEFVRELSHSRRRATLRAKQLAATRSKVLLSGPSEEVAEFIAEMAAAGRVWVTAKGHGFVVSRYEPGAKANIIGVYDTGCDYRAVIEDLDCAA